MVAVDVAVEVAVATGVLVVVGGLLTGAAPASFALGVLLTVVGTGDATQVQVEGQSESRVQLVTLAWQLPGKDVVVVHKGAVVVPASGAGLEGGAGSAPEPLPPPVPDEEDAVPVPPETGPDPEQLPIVVGWHAKPSPQSASALQGSCHLYVHREVVVLVQIGSVGGGVGAQTVLGSHLTATAVPPLQVVVVSPRQTMPWPQSASAWQGAGWQVMDGVGGGVVGQSVPTAQAMAGIAVTMLAWQVRPCAQSLLLAQVCARASPGIERTVARAAMHKSGFVGVMICSFDLG